MMKKVLHCFDVGPRSNHPDESELHPFRRLIHEGTYAAHHGSVVPARCLYGHRYASAIRPRSFPQVAPVCNRTLVEETHVQLLPPGMHVPGKVLLILQNLSPLRILGCAVKVNSPEPNVISQVDFPQRCTGYLNLLKLSQVLHTFLQVHHLHNTQHLWAHQVALHCQGELSPGSTCSGGFLHHFETILAITADDV